MELAPLIAFWLVCAVVGGIIGNAKNAGAQGFILGAMLGPLGVLASFVVDGRLACSRCGTKLNGTPQICPQCHEPVVAAMDTPDDESERSEQEYVRRLREKRQKS